MSVLDFHRERYARMLADLQLDPKALRRDADCAIVDDASRRRLTPALNNQTLAEGLVSAVKLVALQQDIITRQSAALNALSIGFELREGPFS